MKQIILPFRTGKPLLTDVPAPQVQAGMVLIRTTSSVISAGTERMLMDFGKASWFGKMQQQPEKLRQVLDKIKTDGLSPTIRAVRSKLDKPIPLGYSQAGVVIALGTGIQDLKIGDRVASNGAHAELVCVPRNLVARIPENVSDESAAFSILGAIALQGIRLARPTLGETFVVFGLGLIGQLTAQLLLANGCSVLGIDINEERLQIAVQKGVEPIFNPSEEQIKLLTNGHGADAVIITASSGSNEIIDAAAAMCRKRGRIVLTGVVGLNLKRDSFFKKELSFQVSGSYGPGRYEPKYEQHGMDYPIGFVRWTEGRNLEAILEMMRRGSLDLSLLITGRFPLSAFDSAYKHLDNPNNLAAVFTYPEKPTAFVHRAHQNGIKSATGNALAVIGAGNFTSGILLPALLQAKGNVTRICSKSGLSAATLAQKFEIEKVGTNFEEVLDDASIGAVVVVTQHDSHARISQAALLAGKHVFVEKPLALTRAELNEVASAMSASAAQLIVGFNRRFAPLSIAAKTLLDTLVGPMNISITINAGPLPEGHWIKDSLLGGGRILGEACHFIDLCGFFAGDRIIAVCASAIPAATEHLAEDVSILLRFANGSNAVVNYFCNGSKSFGKERVELYKGGHTVVIENWRKLRSYGFKKEISQSTKQDKGHHALAAAWVKFLNNEAAIPMEATGVINSSSATIAVLESLNTLGWVSI